MCFAILNQPIAAWVIFFVLALGNPPRFHSHFREVDIMDNDQGFLQRNFVGLLGRLRVTVSQLLSMRENQSSARSAAAEKVCRYKLDTSEVKTGLLHVDDPVNTGIPSETLAAM